MASKTKRFGVTAALVAAAISGSTLTCVNIAVAMPTDPGGKTGTTNVETIDTASRIRDHTAPDPFLAQSPFARASRQ